jgi:hypothetical protein
MLPVHVSAGAGAKLACAFREGLRGDGQHGATLHARRHGTTISVLYDFMARQYSGGGRYPGMCQDKHSGFQASSYKQCTKPGMPKMPPPAPPAPPAPPNRMPNMITCNTVLPDGTTVGSHVNRIVNSLNGSAQTNIASNSDNPVLESQNGMEFHRRHVSGVQWN